MLSTKVVRIVVCVFFGLSILLNLILGLEHVKEFAGWAFGTEKRAGIAIASVLFVVYCGIVFHLIDIPGDRPKERRNEFGWCSGGGVFFIVGVSMLQAYNSPVPEAVPPVKPIAIVPAETEETHEILELAGVKLTPRQVHLIGAKTEAAGMIFLNVVNEELKKSLDTVILKEYRALQKSYAENSDKFGKAVEIEEEKQKILKSLWYKEVDGGKVELISADPAHQEELEKKRKFLQSVPL